jgi:hypothetical protein
MRMASQLFFAEEAGTQQLRQSFRVVGVGFVDLERQRRLRLSGIHADDRQSAVGQSVVEPGRPAASLEADTRGVWHVCGQCVGNTFRIGRGLAAPQATAGFVDDVDAGGVLRDIKRSVGGHCILL